ncbi:MAG: hypothetical protein HOK71_08995, partial [Planctomycetaceae bacterium]|nr:hypothetical protein [Planctomycetaceae bacterium]
MRSLIWLRKLFSWVLGHLGWGGAARADKPPRRDDFVPLFVTRLEERRVLSTITVTGTGDDVVNGDGEVTLREAITAANTDTSVDGSTAGSGNDEIVFDASLAGQSITLGGSQLPTITGANGDLTINGLGARFLSIDGNNLSRILEVSVGATVEVSGLTLTGGNSGNASGGAILSAGTLTITASQIENSTAETAGGGGGIFSNNAMLTVIDTTISGNTSNGTGAGGGIYNNGGTLTVVNSTISGNQVTGGDFGGGIFNDGTATITNSTIANNSSGAPGGGIRNHIGDTLTLQNTILSGNTVGGSPNDLSNEGSGTITANFSLIENTGGFTLAGGSGDNITGTDPSLGPLQDNGGPTDTHALLASSAAVDAGSNVGVAATDQRGFVRIADGDGNSTATVDIGAFEFQPASFTSFATLATENGAADFTVGDFNNDGIVDLASAYNGTAFSSNNSIFAVFLGVGAGNFAAPTLFNPGTGGCFTGGGLESADFNGDGNLDLVMTHGGSGGGCFGNKVTVHLGDGAGGFAAPIQFNSGGSIGNLAVGDFNGDTIVDLAIPSSDSDAVFVHLGQGDGTFAAPSTLPFGQDSNTILTGDVNSDGDLDLVVTTSTRALVFLGGGDGSFAAPSEVVVANASSSQIGNFNEDALLDLAITSSIGGTVSVFLGVGGGNFSGPTVFAAGTSPRSIDVADFDGDGHQDLVVGSTTTATLSVLPGDGNGGFDTPVVFTTGTNSGSRVRAVDLNGDGLADLSATSGTPAGVSILLNELPTPLTFTTPVGNSKLELRVVGDLAQIVDLDSGTVVSSQQLIATSAITINGTDAGNDLLTINTDDFDDRNITVTYNAGTGANDEVTFTGTAGTVTHDFVNANDGSTTIVDGGNTLTFNYTGLEPITQSITATDVTLNYSASNDIITVVSAGVGLTTVDSNFAESVTFSNPTNSLTINAGAGNDTITVTSFGSGLDAGLSIDGEAGTDSIAFNATVSLTGTNGLNLTADMMTLTGAGITTVDGDITLAADAVLTVNGNTSLGSGGNIELVADEMSLNSTGADVIAATGNITLRAAENATRLRLGSAAGNDVGGVGALGILALTTAELDTLDLNGTLQLGSAAARGATTIDNGGGALSVDVDVSLFVTTLGFANADDAISSTANLTINANGAITDAAGDETTVDVTAGTLTITGATTIGSTAANAFNLDVNTLISSSNGDAFITNADGFAIGAVNVSADDDLNLRALTGNITSDNSTVTADNITLIANAGDIGANGAAINVTTGAAGALNVTATGSDIFITSASDLTVATIVTENAQSDTVQLTTTGAANLTLTGTTSLAGIATDIFDLNTETGTLTIQDNAISVSVFDVDTAGGNVVFTEATSASFSYNVNTLGGSFDSSTASISGTAAGEDVAIDTSNTGGVNAGNISLGALDDTDGNFLNDVVLILTGGSGTDGRLTLNQNIFLDNDGVDASVLNAIDASAVVISGSVGGATLLVIDTESGNNGLGGTVNFGNADISSDLAGKDLSIRTNGNAAGSIIFGNVNDTVGGEFIDGLSLNTLSPGGATIINGSQILLDSGGSASPSLSLNGEVRLTQSLLIDTQQTGNDQAASVVANFATFSATATGVDLTINTSTAAAGEVGGGVDLGIFNDNGGEFINDLTVTTTGGAGATDGLIEFFNDISLDADGTDTADVALTTTRGIVIARDTVIDTEDGNDEAGGDVNFGAAPIYSFGAGFSLTINTATAAASLDGGDVTLDEIGDNTGADAFLSALVIDSRSTNATAGTDGTIELNGQISLDGGVTLAGLVNVNFASPFNLLTIDTAQSANTAGGTIDLQNAQVFATNTDIAVQLIANGNNAAGGDVILGSFDPNGLNRINSLTVRASGDTPSTRGDAIVTADLQTGGSINIQLVDVVDINADLIAGSFALSLSNLNGVDLAEGVTVANLDGFVDSPFISLSGASGTNRIEAAGSNGNITLGQVTGAGGANLALDMTGNGILNNTVNIGGSFDVTMSGAATASFAVGQLEATSVGVTGSGANDTFTFNSTVTSTVGGIAIDNAAVVNFGGAVTSAGAGNIDVSNATTVGVTGDIQTDGGDVNFSTGSDDIDLFGNITIDTNNDEDDASGSVLFGAGSDFDVRPGAAAGNFTLTIDVSGNTNDGNVTLGAIGQNLALGGLSVTADTGNINLNGDIDTTSAGTGSGDVTFGSNTVLQADRTINTGGGVLDFSATNVSSSATGPFDLTVNTGGGNALLSNFDNAGGRFVNNVVVNTAGGTLQLGGTINLDFDSVNDSEAGSFTLGGSTSVLVNANSIVDTEQGDSAAAGDINFGGAIISANVAGRSLALNTATTANDDGGDIFLNSINGGGGEFLQSLDIDSQSTGGGTDGTINIDGGAIAGLGVDGGTIRIAGRVDVGLNALGTLTIDSNDDVNDNAGNIDLSAAQIAATNGNVNLTVNSSTGTDAVQSGGNVTLGSFEPFTGAANRIQTVTVTAEGATNGDVNVPQAIEITGGLNIQNANQVDLDDVNATAITVDGANIDLNGTTYTATVADINLTGAVRLTDNVALNGAGGAGNDITIDGSVTTDGTARTLTVDAQAAGDFTVSGQLGISRLGLLTITDAADVNFSNASASQFTGLTSNSTTFTAAGQLNTTAVDINITADGTGAPVDLAGGADLNGRDMTLIVGGDVTIGAAVSDGGTVRIQGTTNATTIALGSVGGSVVDLTETTLQQIDGTVNTIAIGTAGTQIGLVTINDGGAAQVLTLNTALIIDADGTAGGNGSVSIGSDITVAGEFVINGSRATTTFDGGGSDGTITIDSGGNDITINDTMAFANDDDNVAFISGGGNVSLLGSIDGVAGAGEENITISPGDGNVVLGRSGLQDDFGTVQRLGRIEINAGNGDTTVNADVTSRSFVRNDSTGTLTFNRPLNFDLNGNALDINNVRNVVFVNAATVTTSNTGIVTIDGDTAGTLTIGTGAFDIDEQFRESDFTKVTLGANITTTNDDISFRDAVDLTQNVTLDGGAVRFAGAVNTEASTTPVDLVLTVDDGVVDFEVGSSVGQTRALDSLTVTSAATVNLRDTRVGDNADGAVGEEAIDITATTINLFSTLRTDAETDSGDVDINGNLVLNSAVATIITADGNAGSGNDGDVNISGNVTADTAGVPDFVVDADTGSVTFGGTLGAVGSELGSVDVTAATMNLGGDVRVTGGGDIDFQNVDTLTITTDTLTLDTDAAGDVTDAGRLLGFADVDRATLDLTVDTTANGAGLSRGLLLGTLNLNSLTIAALGVTQSGPWTIATTTDLTSDPVGNISLVNAGNDFVGAVTINNGAGVSVVDANSLTIAAATAQTSLALNAGTTITIDGAVNVNGTAGAVLNANAGVTLNAAMTTANGQVIIDADVDNNGAGVFESAAAGTIATGAGAGDVTITASDVTIGAGINAGGGSILLRPSTAVTIGLGDGSAGTFNIDGTEAGRFTAQALEIGLATSGNIDVTEFNPTNVTNLVLRTTGTVTATAVNVAPEITVTNLAIDSDDGVDLDVNVTTLAVDNSAAGGVAIDDTVGGVTIGSVATSSGTISGVSTNGGAITVNAVDAFNVNDVVQNTGAGNVTLKTTGAGNEASDLTITANVTAADGNIELEGGDDLFQQSGTIQASNAGTITLTVGAGGDADGRILMSDGTRIVSVTGNITLTNLFDAVGSIIRIAEIDSTSGNVLVNSGQIAGNSGTIEVVAGQGGIVTGAGTIQLNATIGVTVNDVLTTANGTITIDADVDNNAVGSLISGADGDVTSGGANVTVIAADVSLSGDIDAGAGTLFLQPSTAASIGLGGAAGSFNLTDAEADLITAAVLEIGLPTSLAISVGDLSLAPGKVATLLLQTDATVNQTPVDANITDIAVTNLAIDADDGVVIDIDATTLAVINSESGFAQITDTAGGLTIGTVATTSLGNVSGVASGGSGVQITANNGLLTVNESVIDAGNSTILGTQGAADIAINAVVQSTSLTGRIELNSGRDLIINDGGANDISVVGTGFINFASEGTTQLNANVDAVTAGGAITFDVEDLVINTASATVNAGAGNVTVQNRFVNRDIDLGTNTANTLGLTDLELDRITAGVIQIGRNDSLASGAVTISSAIDTLNTNTLHILTGSTVTNTGVVAITETNLAINADDGVDIDVDVTTLAVVNSAAGGVNVTDTTGGLTVGTVATATGSVAGVSTVGGGVTLVANSPLTINNTVEDTGGGNITLTASGNAGTDDLTLNANVTASGGSGSIALNAGDSIIQGVASAVSATNAGNITYTAGTGTATGFVTTDGSITAASGAVMLLADAGATVNAAVTTAGGAITIDADVDNNAAGTFTSSAVGDITSGGANVTVIAAAVDMAGDINAAAGRVLLQPSTAGRTIGLGGGTGDFNLTTAEGSLVTTTTSLEVGLSNSGAVKVDNFTAANAAALVIRTAADVTEEGVGDATADITVTNLAIDSATGVDVDVNLTNVAVDNSAGGGVSIDEVNGNLTVGSIATSSGAISGVSTVGGGVTVLAQTGTLTVNNNVADSGGGNIRLENDSTSSANNLVIAANVTASNGNGNIQLLGTDDLTIQSGTIQAAGSGTITLVTGTKGDNDASIQMQAGTRIISDTGNITLTNATDDATVITIAEIDSTSGSVSVTSSGGTNGTITVAAGEGGIVTGAAPIQLNAGTVVTINDVLTTTGNGAITIDAGRANISANLQSDGGTIDLTDVPNVVIDGTVTFDSDFGDNDAAGDILFSTVVGDQIDADAVARTFTIDARGGTDGGTVTLGAVTPDAANGGGVRLDELTVQTDGASGVINVQGGTVETTGSQDFEGPVVVNSPTDSTTFDGTNLTFQSTVRGAADAVEAVTLIDDGRTILNGEVGGNGQRLTNLTTDSAGNGAGVTEIRADISTSGNQTYHDAVELDTPADTVTLTADGDIVFQQTLRSLTDGEEQVIVNADGVTRFVGDVGDNSQRLRRLETDSDGAAGTTEIGANIDTVGTVEALRFGDDVLLINGPVVLTTTASGVVPSAADVVFERTLNGSQNLTLSIEGETTFTGAVGANNAIGTNTGAAITINSTGPTEFQSTVQTASGIAQDDAAGDVTFRENVTVAAGDTATTFDANVVLDGLTFDAANAVSFGNMAADTLRLSGDNVLLQTTGGFGSTLTVNAALSGNQDLTLNAAGTTRFLATVGGSGAAGDLLGDGDGAAITINSAAATDFVNTVRTASGIVQTDAANANLNDLTFREDVTVTGGNTGSRFAGDVTFDGLTFASAAVDAANPGLQLGDNTANDAVTLSGCAVNLTINGDDLLVNSTVNGSQDLTLAVTGNTTFTNTIGNAAGTLDAGFATAGIAISDLGGIDRAFFTAVQADGKIIVVGDSGSIGNRDIVVERYNVDGTLDASFGVGGVVITDLGGDDRARSAAVQADGRIIVAGSSNTAGTPDLAVLRYNTDGTLDAGFGAAGVVITDLGGTADLVASVQVQADGKIVAAGRNNAGNIVVVRHNANGTLDAGFGAGGVVLTDLGSSSDLAESVAVQADGKLVVAGFRNVSEGDFAVVRYNANGTLDAGFGTAGVVITNLGASEFSEAVAVQTDGKIVVAGYQEVGAVDNDIALVRYNADGTLDAGFGTAGAVITDLGGSNDRAFDMVLQADGKIIVAGPSNGSGTNDFAVVRYNTDGTLDAGFGTAGVVTSDLGGADSADGVAVQADGQIVVVGRSNVGGTDDFAIVRFNADATGLGDGTGAAITINSSGATEFQGTMRTASGIAQDDAAGAVTFRENVTIATGDTATTFDANVILDGLTFDADGAITFGNAAADTLQISPTDSGVAVVIDTSSAPASAVTINATATASEDLTINAGDAEIELNGTFNGDVNVALNTTGVTDINEAIGGGSAVSSLTTNVGGTTELNADVSAQGGTLTFRDAVELTSSVTLTDTGSTGLTFEQTVDGPF